jgi:hypothetical protein
MLNRVIVFALFAAMVLSSRSLLATVESSATADAAAERSALAAYVKARLAAKQKLVASLERDRNVAMSARNLEEANAADDALKAAKAEIHRLSTEPVAPPEVNTGADGLRVIRAFCTGKDYAVAADATQVLEKTATGLSVPVDQVETRVAGDPSPGKPKVFVLDLLVAGKPLRLEFINEGRDRRLAVAVSGNLPIPKPMNSPKVQRDR